MANDNIEDSTPEPDFVDAVADQSGVDVASVKPQKVTPSYQIVGEKIPVSKAFGQMVRMRKKAAVQAMEVTREAWDEAYRYYNHDQVRQDVFRTNERAGTWWRRGDSYENLVFANASVMIPSIYAKNPDVSFVTDQDEDKPFVDVLSKAINALFIRKEPYGVHLKPRMKKAALHCELTNMGIIKLEFTEKDATRESAEADMLELAQQLAKVKDPKKVKEIEGKMQAIEEQMEYMEPSGFRLKNIIPTNLIIDPFAENEDGSDAEWMFEEVYLPTDFLNARYTEKTKDGERKLLYKPSHKLKTNAGPEQETMGQLLEAFEDETGGDRNSHTTDERQSYIYTNMTKCWYYWDKPSRRCYLYADNDWTYPIWAWADPLKTTQFFPFYIFQFYPSTGGVCAPGEVSYYLDQQDEINEINAQVRKIRRICFNTILYNNNNIKGEDAEALVAFLKDGKGSNVIGVDVSEGQKVGDAIETITPPSYNYEPLFNKDPIYMSIDKIGSVSDAIRGAQFKTNTTEDAVQAYTSAAQLRLSNRTDAIEECVSQIAWSMAEILVDRGDPEYVRGLIGDARMKDWNPPTLQGLNANYSVEIAAGSSEKPTSKFKKQEAIEIAQSIGQFAQAAPGATLKVVLKLLKNAFPELSIGDEDWESITQEIDAQLQRGVSTPQQGGDAQAGQPVAQAGAAPMPAPAQGGVDPAQLEQILMQLPPEIQQQVVQAVQQGVPPEQALAPILEQMNVAG